MTELHKLSHESIRYGLIRMNDRVFYSAFMGIGLFCGIFYLAPNHLIHDVRFYIYLAVLVYVTSICFIWKWWGAQAIDYIPRGALFRAIFIFHSALFALCCALGIRILLTETPDGYFGIQAASTLLWGCTVAVSTFAFDLVACVGYLIFMLVPIILTSAFQLQNSNGLTATYSVSLLFFVYLARVIHRSEVDILVKEEKLKAQGKDLEASNVLFHDTLSSIDEIFLLLDLNGICYADPTGRAKEVLNFEPLGQKFTGLLGLADELREMRWAFSSFSPKAKLALLVL